MPRTSNEIPVSTTYACATCGHEGELRDGKEMALYLPLALKPEPGALHFCSLRCLAQWAGARS